MATRRPKFAPPKPDDRPAVGEPWEQFMERMGAVGNRAGLDRYNAARKAGQSHDDIAANGYRT